MGNDIFEKAAEIKLRFESGQGQLTVEQLYGLSLESLDKMAVKVNKELKESGEESFIATKPKGNDVLQLKLDILVYIIKAKQVKEAEAKKRAVNRGKLSQLKALAAEKSNEQLLSLPLADINKMIEELQDEV